MAAKKNLLQFVPLLSRLPVQLAFAGDCDPERFIRAFNETWDCLPAQARNALAVRWEEFGAGVFLIRASDEQKGRLGQCSVYGCCFHFFSPAIELMPDKVLKGCIAHEFAHAFFYATDEPYHCGCQFTDEIRHERAEELVRKQSAKWGFEPSVLAAWCMENQSWLKNDA